MTVFDVEGQSSNTPARIMATTVAGTTLGHPPGHNLACYDAREVFLGVGKLERLHDRVDRPGQELERGDRPILEVIMRINSFGRLMPAATPQGESENECKHGTRGKDAETLDQGIAAAAPILQTPRQTATTGAAPGDPR